MNMKNVMIKLVKDVWIVNFNAKKIVRIVLKEDAINVNQAGI